MSEPNATSTETTNPKRPSRPGSIFIFTIAGIPVYLHFSFLLVMAIIALPGSPLSLDDSGSMTGLLFFVLVFTSILLHELGHALAARRFGIKTEDIVLYPIGGIARLRSMGEGLQEFWIAVAGPAVNVVIIGVILGYLRLRGVDIPMHQLFVDPQSILPSLLLANMTIFLFNLIPAFPMDGGRVLRSLLTLVMTRENATALATRIGQAFGILAVFLGIFGNMGIMFAIIGIFVFVSAGQEYSATRSRALVGGHQVHQAMITHFDVLRHGQSLGDAADMLLATNQQDFPVMLGEEVVGVLGRKRLLQGLAERGRDEYIATYMEREYAKLTPYDALEEAYAQLAQNPGLPVLVFHEERLVGYITQENLIEFMMVQQVGQFARER